jgi:glycosyltransferase involved in cell wall biosynthesis
MDSSVSNSTPIELTILMPCLNEAETLARCIQKAQKFLEQNSINGEVLVADNGSTDGSQEIVRRLGANIVHIPRKGYGAALLGGIEAAKGKYIIMGDADDSYDFMSIMPFLEKLRSGHDLVMGNRFQGGIQPNAMPPLHQHLGNPILSGIGRLFFHVPIGDFHCGLRGFSKGAALRMNLQTTGMEFASEMVIKARLNGMRITEVPTTLYPDGRSRRPHLRSWRDGWRHLRFMLLFSPRWLFLIPGILLMTLGTLVGVWLIPSPRHVFGVVLDIYTLLYCAIAILVGFQSTLFAILTKIYGINHNLLPKDPGFLALFRYFKLETGILFGLVLLTGGLAGSILAFLDWQRKGFGTLDPSTISRTIIPAVLATVLGSQIILSSFFMSILGLERKAE